MKTEREMFEEYVKSWPTFSDRTLARDGRHPDYYGNPVIQGSWEAWQARAKAVPVPAELKAYVEEASGYRPGCDPEFLHGINKARLRLSDLKALIGYEQEKDRDNENSHV